jgi:hypothetical protein
MLTKVTKRGSHLAPDRSGGRGVATGEATRRGGELKTARAVAFLLRSRNFLFREAIPRNREPYREALWTPLMRNLTAVLALDGHARK